MNRRSSLVLFCLAAPVGAQALTLDWWEPRTAAATTELADDADATQGSLAMTIRQGVLFPGFPATRTLASGAWVDPLPFGTADVTATDIKVFPGGVPSDFDVLIEWSGSDTLYLLVGDLYGDPSSSTSPVGISSDGGASSVTHIGMFRWSDSLTDFSQPLGWSGSELTTTPGLTGDSEFALFSISGAHSVTLSVPSGYAYGTGDTLTIGIGAVPVPEASTVGMTALFAMLALAHRRR
ncbi:hypothetical protein [Haloferula sargassicola]|uniref:PEP-CTERM protein-sorting domain-containing protein n=1 Tax=Haloferula sargassicola TaxID=490096 RepID=A0ABP9UK40_9BACT